MGVFVVVTAIPVVLVVFVMIIIMAIIGIVVAAVGVGGGIVAAAAVKDLNTKVSSVLFFSTITLVGLCCLAVFGGALTNTYFYIAPMLTIVGAAVVALGIVGFVKALNIVQKPPKIIYAILLLLSTIIGTLLFVLGVLALIVL